MMNPSKEGLKQHDILPYKFTSEDDTHERTEPPKGNNFYISNDMNMVASYLNGTFIDVILSDVIQCVMALQ
eukprot:8434263-Ditylum_brightwellii.AAC.1